MQWLVQTKKFRTATRLPIGLANDLLGVRKRALPLPMLLARIPKGASMMQLVPLREVRQGAIVVSSLHKRCEDGVSLRG